MFKPWASLDYSRRSGFSYERWLEDRSHADVVVKALDRGMIERSEQMGSLLQSIDLMAEDQRAGFEQISSELGDINDTLNWGFVELSAGLDRIEQSTNAMAESLDRIEQATHEVRDSIDKVDKSINQLILAVNSGFKSMTSGLEIANAHLAMIESATVDVDQAWAIAHYKRAVKAMQYGFISDSVELLEAIINGESGRLAYKFDFRFYLLLGACYSGDLKSSEEFKPDMEKAASYFSKAVKYMKMDDDVDKSSIKTCLNSCGWSHYCIGQVDASENYFAKSIGILPEFDSGFGLAKSILSKDDFERAKGIIKYLIVKHRNFALVRMASDPDFINYRTCIIDIRNEVINEIQIANSKDRNLDEFKSSFTKMRDLVCHGAGSKSKLLRGNVELMDSKFTEILNGDNIDSYINSDGSIKQSYFMEMRTIINKIRDEALSEKYKACNDDGYHQLSIEIIDAVDLFIQSWANILQVSDTHKIIPDSHRKIISDTPRQFARPY